jgi:hypothetical protein
MSDAPDQRLLEALLDSWDRNNTILLNLLRAFPEGGLEARAMEGSPSIAQLFTHIHFVRLVFVFEDAPSDAPASGRSFRPLNSAIPTPRQAGTARGQNTSGAVATAL